MAPEYPENMVNKTFPADPPSSSTPLPFFLANAPEFAYKTCIDPRFPKDFELKRKFFGLPSNANCIKLYRKQSDVKILFAESSSSGFTEAGYMDQVSGMETSPFIARIHITPVQTVFSSDILERVGLPYIGGATMSSSEDTGRFVSKLQPNLTRGIILRINAHAVELDGILDSTIHRDLIVGLRPY